ncbi:MAG: ATP-binding cassette domain-containing protein [Deltaproteobacteria bacterium]|nr:ATP-binding cassette domain-containing protein [Deltaproteobacteria bacterium]
MKTLVSVENLKMYFPVTKGLFIKRRVGTVRAVDDVSFTVEKGEILGLVGESGCGKSTTGRAILQLYRPTAGRVVFNGTELTRLKPKALVPFRRHFQIIFQDPYASLNPRMTVGSIVAEPLVTHERALRRRAREDRVKEILSLVGLSPRMIRRYPHEFSGGQRQRIGIARALALHPEFVVADEPVSALDVSVQAQILNLMMELREKLSLTILFIAHDLSVVKHMSDRVAVMYLGKIVEIAPFKALYASPRHPYTEALLSSVPIPDPRVEKSRDRVVLKGDVPSPLNPPSGCHFHTRCPIAEERCRIEAPALVQIGGSGTGHFAACHFAAE